MFLDWPSYSFDNIKVMNGPNRNKMFTPSTELNFYKRSTKYKIQYFSYSTKAVARKMQICIKKIENYIKSLGF